MKFSPVLFMVVAVFSDPIVAIGVDDAPSFESPDGTRAVRLYLETGDKELQEKMYGKLLLDEKFRAFAESAGPGLKIDYVMRNGSRELVIRRFGSRSAGADVRYRVLWDADSRRFLVLTDGPPPRPWGKNAELPRWETGETILYFHDRLDERLVHSHEYGDKARGGARFAADTKAVRLPLVTLGMKDLGKPGPPDKTGEMLIREPGAPVDKYRVPIENFTIAANTQNLRKGSPGNDFPTRVSQPSPDGCFIAQLADRRGELMVLLAEGERYRDQLWPLVIHLRVHNQPVNPPFDGAHRFVWSADSRHLLLLTTGARAPGLAVLPNGEQAYLLFDTVLWEGVIVPGMQDVTRIRFPGLSIAGQPANISR